MCGRARCSLSREELRAAARVSRWQNEEEYTPSFNVAPGRNMPVLMQGQIPELSTMKWGLVPSYTKAEEKPNFFRMFNARSETVASKGVFKKLLGRQRCIVFTNGFYEWKQEGKVKQPYFIHLEGQDVMRMAGLFDVWKGPDDVKMHSFTILTTDSSERLQWLHDRMPVILPSDDAVQAWLDGDESETVLAMRTLCKPYNGEDLQWFAVDTKMSNMKSDGADCCKPLKRKAISSFFKREVKPKCESTPVKLEDTDRAASNQQCDNAAVEQGREVSDSGHPQVLGESESIHAPDGAQLAAEDIKHEPEDSSGAKEPIRQGNEDSTVALPISEQTQAKPDKDRTPTKTPTSQISPSSQRKRQKPEAGKNRTITAFFAKNSA